MEFNRDSFEKALKECKIIRYENIFAKVVKSYLKNETEQLSIAVVVKSFCGCSIDTPCVTTKDGSFCVECKKELK
ncbi:MAG: hypothetical protein QQN55_00970 [Nitrosopumilus sp.]